MRTPAVEKMGYYPTNEPIVELINTWLNPCVNGRARLLDPCAGMGIAAEMIGKHINADTWAAEISFSRAEAARKRLDLVLEDSFFQTKLTDESLSVLFLNPPYEYDHGNGKRYEETFLAQSFQTLMRGGLLVYVVPQQTLMIPRVSKILCGHFENIKVVRFTDDLFPIFKQIIVFATRRHQWEPPTDEGMKEIRALGNPSVDLPVIESMVEPVYDILPAPDKTKGGVPIRFFRTSVSDMEMVNLANQSGILESSEWKDFLNPRRLSSSKMRPAMPLKVGHIALMMASGMMDVVHLTNKKGLPILVKGRAVKRNEQVKESEVEGQKNMVKQVFKDKIITTICTLDPSLPEDQMIKLIEDVPTLTEFMNEYSEKLALHVQKNYTPRYNFDPTPHETAMLDKLGLNMPRLPGQEKPGLLPAQRHAVTAACRSLKANHVASFQAEMGTGKTTMGSSIIYMMNAFPAIILCPPHLVQKWIREVEQTIPGAKAREIVKIGSVKGKNGRLVDTNDVEDFLRDAESGKLGPYPVAVVANSMIWRQSGWVPAVIEDKRRGICRCPGCGQPVVITPLRGDEYTPATAGDMPAKPVRCENAVRGRLRGPAGTDGQGNPVWGDVKCGTLLYARNSSERTASISEYILKHCKGRFKIVVADEVHQYKSSDADRSFSFHHLARSTDYALTLTGTMFGGKSTSIFWLLHRINKSIRHDFAFKDEKRWVRLYGIEETTRIVRKYGDDDYGYTGNRRHKNEAVEKPGISPEIITRFLDSTIFMGIKDLGMDLPSYNEELVTLDMTEEQSEQTTDLTSYLFSLMIKQPRYMSSWLQWGLARPNSAFRDEEVELTVIEPDKKTYDKKWGKGKNVEPVKQKVMDLPAVVKGDELLPKEEWLVNFVNAERAQGRKSLVYLRQTGTRDIRARIVDSLKESGVRARELPTSVDTRKREDWINRTAGGLDALIVNPKMVETGLDLVMFHNVIFYEIEYSLYTVWQAVRRVWRLGQTKPVKAVFVAYAGAMEEKALTLIGAKMKAAQLLYGDEVGGAIVDDSGDDDDFAALLAKQVRSKAKLTDLRSLFADNAKVSHNPVGSFVKPSAVILPVKAVPTRAPIDMSWDDWAKEQGIGSIAKRKTSRPSDNSGQGSLF